MYVYSYGSGRASVQATECSFFSNASYGVYIQRYYGTDPLVSITNSSLHSNAGSYDLYTTGSEASDRNVITARNNWWGTTDAVLIGNRIYDFSDSSSSPIVDRCGFLAEPGGVSYRDGYCPDPAICGENAAWDLTEKPYFLEQPVIICPTGRLDVGPGVQVRAEGGSPTVLSVRGTMEVAGTVAEPVTFFSASSSPAPGQWSGIAITSGGLATIAGATVQHAINGVSAGETGTLTLDGVTLSKNQTHGVQATGAPEITLKGVASTDNGANGLYIYSYGSGVSTTARATGCRFTGNQAAGVYIYRYYGPDPHVTIAGSAIRGNLGSWDLEARGAEYPATAKIWAPDCWWGTENPTQAKLRIYDRDDSSSSPGVIINPFGSSCDPALGKDADHDNYGDMEDNCPTLYHTNQADSDGDGMGDACDPEPGYAPASDCDGLNDGDDGYLDDDGDGWGNPCDPQPTRADSYPGASEICDARDNNGDAFFGTAELYDGDGDGGVLCGDCEDDNTVVNACACEFCSNLIDDDCDGSIDGPDSDCGTTPLCLGLGTESEPVLTVDRGACGGATVSGPFDVINGLIENLQMAAGHVDLGDVTCIVGDLPWDRVAHLTEIPNSRCPAQAALFFLAKNAANTNYGSASTGEPRDTMNPNPACP